VKRSIELLSGLIVCGCGGAPPPSSVPNVAPVVAPLPGPASDRSAEDAELETELEAGLETAGEPPTGAGGATP